MWKKIVLPALFCTLLACDKSTTDNTPVLGSMPSNMVKKVLTSSTGTLWVLTDKGVVSFFSGNWYYHPDLQIINHYHVNDITFCNTSGSNRLWVSTYNGAYGLNIIEDKIESVEKITKSDGYLKSDIVWTVASGFNNDLYFGTSKGITVKYENTWDTTFIGRVTEEILQEYQISTIVVAKNNWVYAATLGGGTSRFKYQNPDSVDAITGATTYIVPWAKGMKSDTVFSILIANDTCQWFGTARGVGFHDTYFTKRGWDHYCTEDGGLVCDSVYSIAKDNLGNIWFGTNAGIKKYDGTNVSSITTAEGMVNNHVNSIALDLDGSLWLGTDGGLSHYSEGKFVNFNTN
jgi:ligand-binding sensor domain-containing protein